MTAEELAALEALAEGGDPEAQYRAGCARHEDENVALRSRPEAIRWLNLAGGQGHGPAWRRLGYMAVVEDRDAAAGREFDTRAAEAGDADGAVSLAASLSGDTGPEWAFACIELDLDAAIRWARKSARQDNPRAMCLLGALLLRSTVTVPDRQEGCEWLNRASKISFLRTMYAHSEEMKTGRMVPIDSKTHLDEAAPQFPFQPSSERLVPGADLNRLQTLAREGSLDAVHDLGVLCFFNRNPLFARLPNGFGLAISSAHDHFRFAAEKDHPASCFALGCIEVCHPGYGSLNGAFHWLDRADRHGVPGAREAVEWLDRWGRLSVRLL